MNLKFWKRAPRVPLVRMGGMIVPDSGGLRRGMNLETLAPLLHQAFHMPRAKAVALAINSPGGSPVQSALIAARIRALAAEKSLPVLAFVEDVAASGGYWLATAADEIFADEASVVGSIGVISAGFGFTEAMGKLGVERRVHTAGENKGILDPFQPEKPEDVARLDAILQELHGVFRTQVESRRGAKLTKDDPEIFSGAFWTGRGAMDRGLVDGIGHFRPVLLERYGKNVQIVPIKTKPPLIKRLTGGGFGAGLGAEEFAGELAGLVDERLARQRYGG